MYINASDCFFQEIYLYIWHSISEFVVVMVCLDSKKEMHQWKFASSVSRIATDLEMGNWKRAQGGVRLGKGNEPFITFGDFLMIFLEFGFIYAHAFFCYDGECVDICGCDVSVIHLIFNWKSRLFTSQS